MWPISTDVVWSVYVSGTRVSCGRKTAEQMEILFAVWLVRPRNHVLDWVQMHPREGVLLRGCVLASGHCSVPVHDCIVHCSPVALGECVSTAHAADVCILCHVGWLDSNVTFCQITLNHGYFLHHTLLLL